MKKQLICKCILMLSDFILFSVSLLFAIFFIELCTQDIYSYLPKDEFYSRILIHIILGGICVVWFWIRLRHYTYRKPFWFELKEILRILLIFSIIELAIVAFSKTYFSRYLWVLTLIITLFLVPLGRILIKKFLIKTGAYLKNAIIIGSGQNAIDAYKALISEPYLGFNIKYFVTMHKCNQLKELNIPIISEDKQHLWELVTKKSDQFIIALEDDENDERDYWLRYLSKNHYRSISVIPTLRGLPLYSTDMSFLFSYEVLLLRVNNNLAKRSSRILKRTMDIWGSLILIVLLSPFLLILYFLIRIDGGDAIYGHERVGRNGKNFKCLKFRSMVVNADQVLKELLEKDSKAKAEWKEDRKLHNDPRITKIGRFIRKWSIDELPQLFNVLKGEMSLVGPRPIVKAELKRYQEDVDYYLMAKPGMTGLWQVSGRNNVDYDTRVYFDAWYVKNWSLWNDVAILFKTIKAVRHRSGAY
ncbi:undecaprenyl-phosphate galactose phosphotransferase WbaP [Basfia succiniciproducens]|uniref:Undecaprenyl-phosphate galactose phosphotransferase n=1 Tax=Basfia succiniciproducens TaxID=653940 RepID=A0A1G5BDI6_9PAST|nr:undecaprenyl-phosphate galactose phosphotransferase WbaP [Basfia succiniciproducens]QIM68105.1 UDP-phosphate galactose phosphotransferase [Basfia succiniciproducens]SCX88189.1 undecaprenyl-phosphate galactose phosphotransferase [Basfia succiniciproducens]